MLKNSTIILFAVLITTFSALAAKPKNALQSLPKNVHVAQNSPENLLEKFNRRDYESALAEAEKSVVAEPLNVLAQAWRVILLSRNDRRREALSLAEKLAADFPSDVWAQIALIDALNQDVVRRGEAVSRSEKLLAENPSNEDVWRWRLITLQVNDKLEESVKLLEQNSEFIAKSSQLSANRGFLTFALARQKSDEKLAESGLEILQKTTANDPTNFNANYFLGFAYLARGELYKAQPWLEKAVKISPASFEAQRDYWQSLLSPDKQQKAIVAAINAALQANPDSPKILQTAIVIARQNELASLEKQLSEIALSKFPNSVADEDVQITAIKKLNIFSKEGKINQAEAQKFLPLAEALRKRTRFYLPHSEHHLFKFIGYQSRGQKCFQRRYFADSTKIGGKRCAGFEFRSDGGGKRFTKPSNV